MRNYLNVAELITLEHQLLEDKRKYVEVDRDIIERIILEYKNLHVDVRKLRKLLELTKPSGKSQVS